MDAAANEARDAAVALMKAGKSNAEVWDALVKQGVDGTAAQALILELDKLRQAAPAAARAAGCRKCGASDTSYLSRLNGAPICGSCHAREEMAANVSIAPMQPQGMDWSTRLIIRLVIFGIALMLGALRTC